MSAKKVYTKPVIESFEATVWGNSSKYNAPKKPKGKGYGKVKNKPWC